MGLRQGVTLPSGVTGLFAQFLDDYLDPKNSEFTEWLWRDYMENALRSGTLQLIPTRVVGGLCKAQEAWNLLRQGAVSGERLAIVPSLEERGEERTQTALDLGMAT
ncbi:hypothetical protein N658DRAFT_505446 [Parathielavia hyrcaniae]|uniref:Uncharacterized protein n=1 Tax=Parathielavia hyrcaniae TaxID=113614 RepID=A0AAN6Q3Q8_9PEZI|nr:hypothetical protein N658DRAFT_505446 [Parathielavia hyrcaniae]